MPGALLVEMTLSRTTSALTAAACVLVAPAAVGARAPKNLWATVNVCNTPKSPNEMGVRARMPGDGTEHRMFMRFTAEFRSHGTWKAVAGKGRSKWLLAGSAVFTYREFGYTFGLDPPPPGTTYLLRGQVDFQWRQHGKVVRRARRFTQAGHPTAQSQPKGFSAATCRISTAAKRR